MALAPPFVTSQPHSNLLPGSSSAVLASGSFTSLVLRRPPSSAYITFAMLPSTAGTMTIEALWHGGSEAVAADWWEYPASGEEVTAIANQAARITINCGAPVMRIRFTPSAFPCTISRAEAFYTAFTR